MVQKYCLKGNYTLFLACSQIYPGFRGDVSVREVCKMWKGGKIGFLTEKNYITNNKNFSKILIFAISLFSIILDQCYYPHIPYAGFENQKPFDIYVWIIYEGKNSGQTKKKLRIFFVKIKVNCKTCNIPLTAVQLVDSSPMYTFTLSFR